jgi:hypothetical protein
VASLFREVKRASEGGNASGPRSLEDALATGTEGVMAAAPAIPPTSRNRRLEIIHPSDLNAIGLL